MFLIPEETGSAGCDLPSVTHMVHVSSWRLKLPHLSKVRPCILNPLKSNEEGRKLLFVGSSCCLFFYGTDRSVPM